jgi:hypothetical protein
MAGAGGQRVQIRKTVSREGFPITSDRNVANMLDNLVTGTKGRISSMDLMSAYISQAANTPDERMAKLIPQFQQKLVAVKVDPSATVRAWALYTLAGLAPNPAKSQQVQEMSRSADWQTRLVAALRTSELGPDTRKSILTELGNDPEPIVKDYADALAGPTTTPTTVPAK